MIVKKFLFLKWCRFAARFSLFAIMALLLCCAGVWGFLQFYGNRIIASELEELKTRTGLDITIGYLDVTFLPFPALSLTDLHIRNKNFELVVPWSFARPDFFRLFTGKFLPAELTFLRPFLNIQSETKLSSVLFSADADNAAQVQTKDANFDWKAILAPDCRIRISQLDARIGGVEEQRIFIGNLSANLVLNSSARLNGDLQIGRIGIRDEAGKRYVLRHPSVSGDIDLINFFKGTNTVAFQSGIFLSDIFQDGTIQIDFNSQNGRNLTTFMLKGDLLLANYPEQLLLEGDADFESLNRFLAIKRLNWQLGADSGKLQSIISLPENIMDFKVDGSLYAHRLSLAQWFGFGRNLSPGLQLSLDNIYDATLRFHLDIDGLEVPQIAASCNGSAFKGKGSVQSFKEPVVFLDLETDKTNLGLAVEESVGVSPQQPWFPYPPLTPMPGEPLQEGETGVGYDINIAAKTLVYGPLQLTQAKLRIYPGKINNDGLEEVLLAGNAKFYGGNLSGECILGAPASLPITIKGNCVDVNGGALASDLAVWPFSSGRFTGNAAVTSEGKELAGFLKNLKGNVAVAGEKAAIKNFNLEKIELGCTLKEGGLAENRIFFDGDWKLSARNADLLVNSSLMGKMNFSEGGAAFKNLSWSGNLTTRRNFMGLPAAYNFKATGHAGLQMEKNEISVSSASIESNEVAIAGSAVFDYKKFLLHGNFSTKRLNVKKLLAVFDIRNLDLSPELIPNQVESGIRADTKLITLDKLKIKMPQSTVEGSLDALLDAERPDFKFNLAASRYSIPKSSSKNSETPWDFSFLKTFDADGILSLKKLEGWQAEVDSIRAPLRLQKGILNINEAEARLYDGKVKLSGQCNFNSGLSINVKTNISAINLARAVKDQKVDMQVGGTGFFNANLSSMGNTSRKLMESLNGSCDFLVSNGYWQSMQKSAKSKPTRFNKIQASAIISNGRFSTNDFKLQGPELDINGSGYLNLVKRDLDYTLNVNMKGVPDFPLYIYGSFDKPKTRIGAGKLVLNALGGLATGVGRMIGGIGEGFVKLFK